MTDYIIIKRVEALGYELYWSTHYNMVFYRHTVDGRTHVSGPFKTLDDAAYAALSDWDNAQAIARDKEVRQIA